MEKEVVIPETGKIEVKNNFSMLDKAEDIVKRMEAANKRSEEILLANEQIAAKIMLSGRSEGYTAPKVEVPMTDIEYSKRFFNGELR